MANRSYSSDSIPASTISPNISIADLDALYHDDVDTGSTPLRGPEGNNVKGQDYKRYASFLTDQEIQTYFDHIVNEAFKASGYGGSQNVIQNFLSRLDRYGTVVTPLNTMNYGYTFITRPRLNLTGSNLRHWPPLIFLQNNDPNTIPFMIRALLDTRMCNGEALFRGVKLAENRTLGQTEETINFANAVLKSGLVDRFNPFLVPLCNGLKGISGFPDFTLTEETSEGDYYSTDFTFIKGGDFNSKTIEMTLEFRDIQGSVILAILYVWSVVIALQAQGLLMAYQDDIYEQRLNYTVSIYRFVTDTSKRTILWWAKATGCFPKSVPVGAIFNMSQDETIITAAQNFSIPFVVNDVKYNDPGILLDFNRLVERYAGKIFTFPTYENIKNKKTISEKLKDTSSDNFKGIPYINTHTAQGICLEWYTNSYYRDTLGLDTATATAGTSSFDILNIEEKIHHATALQNFNTSFNKWKSANEGPARPENDATNKQFPNSSMDTKSSIRADQS